MRALVAGIGVMAEGLADWASARSVLAGQTPYEKTSLREPRVLGLAPNEARRCPLLARYAIDVGMQALEMSAYAAVDVGTVFSSASGDLDIADKNCRALTAAAPALSPTLFHNSVHNAVAGYWGIATGAQTASISLSAYDDSFGAGLLEALTTVIAKDEPTLYVAYDLVPPPMFLRARSLVGPFAVALLLAPVPKEGTVIDGAWLNEKGEESTLLDPHLEALRRGNPAARSLPLLRALARGEAGKVHLRCGGETSLDVEVIP